MTGEPHTYIATSLAVAAVGMVCCIVGYRRRRNRAFIALAFVWVLLAVIEVAVTREFGRNTTTDTSYDGDGVVITTYTLIGGFPIPSFALLGLTVLLLWKETAAQSPRQD